MKIKILNLLLLITSLFGYLEWGKGNHSFLFEAEYEVLYKLFTDPRTAVHAFSLIPLFGQILLLVTLFQAKPVKILFYVAICSLGLLLGFMFLIALLEMNFKILLSVLPFIVIAIFTIRELHNPKSKAAL